MHEIHELSNRAQALYAFMRKEYIRGGYLYAGAIHESSTCTRLQMASRDFSGALGELLGIGLVQRRDCPAWCWELTPAVRHQLIYHHGLAELWQSDAPFFYPNDPLYGETARVSQQVADLCCTAAERLLLLEALDPGAGAPLEARWAVAVPIPRGCPLCLARLRMEDELARHTLQVLQAYVASLLLETLRNVPLTRMAERAAVRLIGDPRLEEREVGSATAAHWIVPCLFAESDARPTSPCLAPVSLVSQDSSGALARERVRAWRDAVASLIEEVWLSGTTSGHPFA